MALEHKPVDALDENDLQALVDSKVSERKTIEYKSALPSDKDNEKKEFLADVSSFANASGGYLIYGIEEKNGVPTQLVGLETANRDEAVRRLDDMIRQGIQPRIPGHQTHAIALQNSRVAIVMRIPHSWNAPHMVTFGNSSRFFARTSNGKYQLDVGEIRSAFLRSETQADRIRGFRADRLARIIAGDTPAQLIDGPKIVLHIVPLSAFDPGLRFNLSAPEQRTVVLASAHPIGSSTANERYNLDGILHIGKNSYVQFFRNGCVEAVDASTIPNNPTRRIIPHYAFEDYLIIASRTYLAFLRQLGVELPLMVMVSLLGVKGYSMVDFREYPWRQPVSIDRDEVVIPEVLLENADMEPAQFLKPCFDAAWNAAGWARSLNYDEQGNRKYK